MSPPFPALSLDLSWKSYGGGCILHLDFPCTCAEGLHPLCPQVRGGAPRLPCVWLRWFGGGGRWGLHHMCKGSSWCCFRTSGLEVELCQVRRPATCRVGRAGHSGGGLHPSPAPTPYPWEPAPPLGAPRPCVECRWQGSLEEVQPAALAGCRETLWGRQVCRVKQGLGCGGCRLLNLVPDTVCGIRGQAGALLRASQPRSLCVPGACVPRGPDLGWPSVPRLPQEDLVLTPARSDSGPAVSAAGPVSEGDCWGWMRGRLPREARQVPRRGCWDQAVVGAAGESECCRSWVGRTWRRRQRTPGLCTTGGSRGPAVRPLRGVVGTSKGRQCHLQGHGLCGWEAQASLVWRPRQGATPTCVRVWGDERLRWSG